jgi:hypothetical protein
VATSAATSAEPDAPVTPAMSALRIAIVIAPPSHH